MVMKGQFLERPTLIPLASGLVLEGVAHRGRRQPGVLVLPPNPSEGGSMDHVVGAEVAFAVATAGHSSLRFNFRGVGASQGRLSTQASELIEDALAACELATANADGTEPLVVTLGTADRVALALWTRVKIAGLTLIHPSIAPNEVPVGMNVSVVLPELERQPARRAWAAQLDEGALTIVHGSDRAYLKNLPQVGRAVVNHLMRLGARASRGGSH